MSPKYEAFLSYSSRYADWVAVLFENLERTLGEGKLFFDREAIQPGDSWVNVLQDGLARSRHLVLVCAPEAFASPWVLKELNKKLIDVAADPDRRIIPLMVVDAPKPPFLDEIHHIDFTDPEAYRSALEQLVRVLGAELPDDVTLPPALEGFLAADLQRDLRALVAGPLDQKPYRRALTTALGLNRNALEEFPTNELAANAALVLSRGDDTAEAAALRVLAVVVEEYDDIEGVAERAEALRQRIQAAPKSAEGGDLLSRYREHVRDGNAELVPYFLPESGSAVLDHVYVELDLDSDLFREEMRKGDDEHGRERPRLLEELLALDPSERPWVTRRWLVRGDPGAGKTTLLRHYAHRLAVGAARPDGAIPVYASLPRLMREREPLLDALERRLSSVQSARGLAAALQREGEEGRLVVLLDGLDEVPRGARADVRALIGDLARRWPDATIVVASRPIGLESPGAEFREVTILPLDREHRIEFLGRWFAPEGAEPDRRRAETELKKLEGDASLWEIAGTPLYLTLIAILLAKGEVPSSRRTQLYDQIFDLLFEGKHKPDSAELDPLPLQETVRKTLARLALSLTDDERTGEPVEQLETRLLREDFDDLRETLERHGPWRHRLRQFLKDVAKHTGILGPHDGEDEDWRFWHKSFGEALVAEALEERYMSVGLGACLETVETIEGDLGRWAEPYALLAGRVKGRDALVEALCKVNRPLGLRALATAQGLQPETLKRILALTDDWEERRAVIEAIVEQVGDAERGIRLLEQLAKTTRDGNDLYFIEETVRAAEESDPKLATLGGGVRARLFDHAPKPEEVLPKTVRTVDGEVSLWARIPKGRFRMGSPESEDGRYGDEGPQHEVVIEEDFWIMRVPVAVAMYRAFDPDYVSPWTDGVLGEEREHVPAVNVTWYEAVSFSRWLGGDLPSEGRWEYACRGGEPSPYSSGEKEADLARVGWYGGNAEDRPHRVGEKPANPYRLYDVHGNAWEWCRDAWSDDYEESGPSHPDAYEPEDAGARSRVLRGGSFASVARVARSASRDYGLPVDRNGFIGFRPARASPPAT